METAKKIWRFISSMRFAIILLVLVALVCSLGSLITQGQSYSWYAQRYSERTAALIVATHMDDVFHSWWFALINGFLCLNLLLCNLLRMPALLRRSRAEASSEAVMAGGADVSATVAGKAEDVFRRLRMPKPTAGRTGDREFLFSAKNGPGMWGAWVCHLGILLLIAGFALGQMTQRTYAVYGVPGQMKEIGDTGYALGIDDFRIGLREDDTVEQYTADITVYDLHAAPARSESASISVNSPATLYGMKFYQNSTGWAAKVSVLENGAPLQEEILCAGEYLSVADRPELVVFFNAFYPDYVLEAGSRPSTASGRLNNPAYLYSVYYQGQIIGMNALLEGEEITIDDYAVLFSEPRSYTLIQVKVDHFTALALAGGIITMLGLLLAFYVRPVQVWALKAEGGWEFFGKSRKGGAIFREQFLRAAGVGEDKEGNDHAAG